MKGRIRMETTLADGSRFVVESYTRCCHCGELTPPSTSAEHLLTCKGAPAEIHRLAQAALDLDAIINRPEGDSSVTTAAQALGVCIAEADFQKNPEVTVPVLLDDVDSFGGQRKPWFHQAVRDAAVARLVVLKKRLA